MYIYIVIDPVMFLCKMIIVQLNDEITDISSTVGPDNLLHLYKNNMYNEYFVLLLNSK